MTEDIRSEVFWPYDSIPNKVDGPCGVEVADRALPEGTMWIATPKFHGVNTCVTVWVKSKTVRFGRRNGYLKPKESHYDVLNVVGKYEWSSLCQLFPAADSVVVYGELYGGVFGKGGGQGAVQKEVHYDPKRAFVGFDILVNNKFLSFYDTKEVLRKLRVPCVPVLARGTAKEMLGWARAHADDPAFLMRKDLRVQELGGKPNTGEGWVIRPVMEQAQSDGSRMLFKVKSAHFDETPAVTRAPGPVSSKKDAGTVSSVEVPQLRVASVLSKEPSESIVIGNLQTLTQRVLDDVLKDFPGLASEKEMNQKLLRGACFQAVKLYLSKK